MKTTELTAIETSQEDVVYLRCKEIAAVLGGMNRTSFYRLRKSGKGFPAPIKVLGTQLWKRSEVLDWAERQKEAA